MSAIDVHCHIVPEKFPAYAGKNRDVPWPSMADAHACHKHVMISGKVYRTVSDGCWSVARRIADMGEMRVTRQAISPMPELLSYWLPLDDAATLIRYLNDTIAAMVGEACGRVGGGMSRLLARRVHAWTVMPKAREALGESPAVTARRFYYDELVFDPLAVRHVIATFGASQIMVGSDYPFALGDPRPVKT